MLQVAKDSTLCVPWLMVRFSVMMLSHPSASAPPDAMMPLVEVVYVSLLHRHVKLSQAVWVSVPSLCPRIVRCRWMVESQPFQLPPG